MGNKKIKFTEEQLKTARDMAKKGISSYKIAEHLGCSQYIIYYKIKDVIPKKKRPTKTELELKEKAIQLIKQGESTTKIEHVTGLSNMQVLYLRQVVNKERQQKGMANSKLTFAFTSMTLEEAADKLLEFDVHNLGMLRTTQEIWVLNHQVLLARSRLGCKVCHQELSWL